MNRDYKMQITQRIRPLDVELSEDLYRRMPEFDTVKDVCDFFHHLLAQYVESTVAIRATMNPDADFEVWYVNFLNCIFPFLSRNRLPPCTDLRMAPIYRCASAAL